MAKTNLPPLPWCNDVSVIEAGCDEAGRGCLAGPVTAAAVILPPGFTHPWLNDSKKLTERRRDELRAKIDRALDALSVRPEAVIVDGNRFKPYRDLPWTTFVKGDGRFGNIAAASILAKTHRDELMKTLDGRYPGYGWAINKGYPTAAHREAITQLGPTPLHRMTFQLTDRQLTLF